MLDWIVENDFKSEKMLNCIAKIMLSKMVQRSLIEAEFKYKYFLNMNF